MLWSPDLVKKFQMKKESSPRLLCLCLKATGNQSSLEVIKKGVTTELTYESPQQKGRKK